MRIFITGCAGFIGSNLAEALLKRQHEVFGLDDLSGGFEDNVPEGVEWSSRSCAQIERVMPSNIDVLYHCAAAPYEGVSSFSPSYVGRSVYQDSVDVFVSAIKHKVRRIVFLSSMARYGRGAPPYLETDATFPVDPYGIAKVAAEETLRALASVHKFEWTIAVPHNVYGPKQCYTDPYRNVAAIFVNRLLQGKAPIIYGDGHQKRCFSYVDDAVDCLVKMATQSNVLGEIINIGPDEEPITIGVLASILGRLTDTNFKPIRVPSRPAEVREAHCSSDKARALLSYRTNTPLTHGMRRLVDWIKKRGPRPFNYRLPLEIINEHTPRTWVEELI